jgi:hypothetical protein
LRADRIRNLWPKLEPKLRAVALGLLGKFKQGKYMEVEEILPEALFAIKQIGRKNKKLIRLTHSDRIKACQLSYLIHRGYMGMKKYLLRAKTLEYQEFPTDFNLFF